MFTQENNQKTSNLLLDSASVWKELTEYRYEITYGYKKNYMKYIFVSIQKNSNTLQVFNILKI